MKVGIICEGENTDAPVLEEILKHKYPNTDFKIVARDKKAIFSTCHLDIDELLGKGFNNIAVIWDLLPVGKQMIVASQWSDKPSRREQKKMFLEKLTNPEDISISVEKTAITLMEQYGFKDNNATQPRFNLKLICICYTMDGWLLSDDTTIRKIASTDEHPVRTLTPSLEKPDLCKNPAGLLTRIFRGSPNKKIRFYNKFTHNIDIVKKYISDGRIDTMKCSSSYTRLIDTLNEWGAT